MHICILYDRFIVHGTLITFESYHDQSHFTFEHLEDVTWCVQIAFMAVLAVYGPWDKTDMEGNTAITA